MNLHVELDIFRGPLDLLFYLVRKHELEASEVPVAAIIEQFLDRVLAEEQLDVNLVGEFIALASALMELKSHQVLPSTEEVDQEPETARSQLVQHLLQYKQYRDAASTLEERSRWWQQRYPRLSVDLPPRGRNLAEEPLHEVELWDLVSAFARIVREAESIQPSNIVYDDTPIHVYMSRIYTQLRQRGQLSLNELFSPGMHISQAVGILLAVLELTSHRYVMVEQNELFGQIWLIPCRTAPEEVVEFTPATTADTSAEIEQ